MTEPTTKAGRALLNSPLVDVGRWNDPPAALRMVTDAIADAEAEARDWTLATIRERVGDLDGWNAGTIAIDCVRRREVLAILDDLEGER